jgi:hypothetical protein
MLFTSTNIIRITVTTRRSAHFAEAVERRRRSVEGDAV